MFPTHTRLWPLIQCAEATQSQRLGPQKQLWRFKDGTFHPAARAAVLVMVHHPDLARRPPHAWRRHIPARHWLRLLRWIAAQVGRPNPLPRWGLRVEHATKISCGEPGSLPMLRGCPLEPGAATARALAVSKQAH